MIEIRHLNKKYPGKLALSDVSFDLPRGEIVGLLGENGAGKTTLMKCMLGLTRFEGSVTLDGEPVSHRNIAALSFGTGEHSFFPGLTAQDHRVFYEAHFPRFSAQRFHGLLDFFSLPPHRKLRTFSMGQQNQFEVILALSQGADYILLDEPFAGNDVFNREDFYKVLSGILEPHETLLLSTHLIEEVSGILGRALLLRGGRLVGDLSVPQLEEEGKTLLEAVKETYRYRADRVGRALGALTGEEELP